LTGVIFCLDQGGSVQAMARRFFFLIVYLFDAKSLVTVKEIG
jgi:hypothetical protein